MADPNFSWIYLLIFLAIPLARIIPRFVARRRQQHAQNYLQHADQPGAPGPEKPAEPQRPQTKERLVLRELHQGANTFEKIQKNTGMDGRTLDSVLESLEKDGLMKVVQKRGMLGSRVELYSTDKGFKEYYS